MHLRFFIFMAETLETGFGNDINFSWNIKCRSYVFNKSFYSLTVILVHKIYVTKTAIDGLTIFATHLCIKFEKIGIVELGYSSLLKNCIIFLMLSYSCRNSSLYLTDCFDPLKVLGKWK